MDNVLERVKNHPFSVILLDEIEKACSEVINLFLHILDEGIITDSHGNKVSFKNTIIIMTSNIGSDRENIGFNKKQKDDKELQNILSTPFVNRINKVLYFKSIEKDDIHSILKSKLNDIKLKYRKNNIKITVNKKVLEKIIDDSKYDVYGARMASKMLEDKIDEIVIDGILNGKRCVTIKI